MSIEAMKQALQALEVIDSPLHMTELFSVGRAITALRAAISEAEKQEDVSPRREWRGLTEGEIKALLPGAVRVPPGWRETVAAIEQALRDKNG